MRAHASNPSLTRAASVLQLVNSRAKSFQESAESSAKSMVSTMKAKAQSFSTSAKQVQEKVAEKRAASKDRTKQRASTKDDELVTKICDDFGVSHVAARLALSKSTAGPNKIQIACAWLFDEKNVEEIEAAENAEIARMGVRPSEVSEKAAPPQEARTRTRSPAREARPVSSPSDDGRGLGFFMSRKSIGSCSLGSFPSPSQVPVPGRLSLGSRRSTGSARRSTGSVDSGVGDSRPSVARRTSMGSQTSGDLAMTPNGTDMESLPLLEQAECPGDEGVEVGCGSSPPESSPLQAAGAQQELSEPEIEEDDEEEDEDEVAPLPPDSACWDWPLSRHEKKARIVLMNARMNEMDRRSLKQEVSGLKRRLSMGDSHRKSLGQVSRLST